MRAATDNNWSIWIMHWSKNGRYGLEDIHGRVILLHDNASSHTKKPSKRSNEGVLPHPPYSPDLAPSDYHLFGSMAHGLADQHFANYEEVAKWLESWLGRNSTGRRYTICRIVGQNVSNSRVYTLNKPLLPVLEKNLCFPHAEKRTLLTATPSNIAKTNPPRWL